MGRTFIALILVCTSLCVHAGTPATDQEIAVKTAFIYKFIHYVVWPDQDDGKDSRSEFLISVVGDAGYLEKLEELASRKTVNGKKIVVKQLSINVSLIEAQIIVIATDDKSVLRKTFNRIEGLHALTISDASGFAELGTIINFVTVETDKGHRKIGFEINQQAATSAGLKIGAQLLKLAILVKNKTEIK